MCWTSIGHSLKILAPLRKLFAPPAVPSWLRAWSGQDWIWERSFASSQKRQQITWNIFTIEPSKMLLHVQSKAWHGQFANFMANFQLGSFPTHISGETQMKVTARKQQLSQVHLGSQRGRSNITTASFNNTCAHRHYDSIAAVRIL